MLVSLLALASRSHAQDLSFIDDLIPDVTSLLPLDPSQFSCSDSDIVECEALNEFLEATFVCDSDNGFCTPECVTDDDCALLQSCDSTKGYCVQSIECSDLDDNNCPSELGSVCDLDSGFCTQENLDPCTSDAGCASRDGIDYVCYENLQSCIPACSSDDDCGLLALYGATCNSGECVYECTSDDDCLGDFANTCDTETTNLCYHSCSTDDDCSDPTPTCLDLGDTGVGSTCVLDCASDADCFDLEGAVCRNNTAFGVPVSTCVLDVECEVDADCDDGISNTCFETPIGISVCVTTCEDDSDCEIVPGAQCLNDTNLDTGLRTCSIDPTCETDADCGDDGVTNTCFESPFGNYCIFSCQSDDDCEVTEFFLEASCVNDTTFGSGIFTCQVAECETDEDCGDDGLTNTCVQDVELFGEEVPRAICTWTCSSDDDCALFAGTECQETEELPGGLSICQPAAVTCDSDSDCSDGWKCNDDGNIPGLSDVLGTNACYPDCDSVADCEALGFENAPCETISVDLGLQSFSVKFCDVSVEAPSPTAEPSPMPTADPTRTRNPTMDPTASPSMDPTASPTAENVDNNSEGVRGSVMVAGLFVLAVAQWM